jgi:hypothetical protein
LDLESSLSRREVFEKTWVNQEVFELVVNYKRLDINIDGMIMTGNKPIYLDVSNLTLSEEPPMLRESFLKKCMSSLFHHNPYLMENNLSCLVLIL